MKGAMKGVSALAVLVLAFPQAKGAAMRSGSVYCTRSNPDSNPACTVKMGVQDPKADAWGNFTGSYLTTGWDVLHIETPVHSGSSPEVGDELSAYGAGYLEAALTWERMHAFWHDFFPGVFGIHNTTQLPKAIATYLSDNDRYIESQIKDAKTGYWQGVGLIYSQQMGLQAGYAATITSRDYWLSPLALRMLTATADLQDLIWSNWKPSTEDVPRSQTPGFDPSLLKAPRYGHCSALFKLKDDMSDVFFGHTTWFSYISMNRIAKTYKFPYKGANSTAVHFPSYPGMLVSMDDFYLTSGGLVSIETSLGNYNGSLNKLISAEGQLPYWVRINLANRMAATSEDWCTYFAKHNSGTYNNQWMVLTLNSFRKGYALPKGSFYVLEQFPGPYIEWADQTATLNFGYWPSYNIPFYKRLYDISGYPEEVKKHGPSHSYSGAPRAEIFRRNESNINTFQEFQEMMRYNNFQHDPLAHFDDAWGAIAARGDLTPNHPSCSGGTDSKASSASLWGGAEAMTFYAQAGPTYNQQPVFDFAEAEGYCGNHTRGMPNRWDFPWVRL